VFKNDKFENLISLVKGELNENENLLDLKFLKPYRQNSQGSYVTEPPLISISQLIHNRSP